MTLRVHAESLNAPLVLLFVRTVAGAHDDCIKDPNWPPLIKAGLAEVALSDSVFHALHQYISAVERNEGERGEKLFFLSPSRKETEVKKKKRREGGGGGGRGVFPLAKRNQSTQHTCLSQIKK